MKTKERSLVWMLLSRHLLLAFVAGLTDARVECLVPVRTLRVRRALLIKTRRRGAAQLIHSLASLSPSTSSEAGSDIAMAAKRVLGDGCEKGKKTGMAEGQGFEPWRALRLCRFSVRP